MIYIIIQARSTSTRLPNKCMADICGSPTVSHGHDVCRSPMIQCVYDICKRTNPNVVVAIPFNDPIKTYLRENHILFYEGDEQDVLRRYYHCAKTFEARWIVRITSDCPLLPVSTLQCMQALTVKEEYDFLTNLPCVDGHDIEIVSFPLLEWCYKTAPDGSHREHVTTYIKERLEKVRQMGYSYGQWREPYLIEWFPKLSVDTQEDLDRVRSIMAKMS